MGNSNHANMIDIGKICIYVRVGYIVTSKDGHHLSSVHLNLLSTHSVDLDG